MKIANLLIGTLIAIALTEAEVAPENNASAQTMHLSSFKAKKILPLNEEARLEAEEKQLEEDGFCPCSVQRP